MDALRLRVVASSALAGAAAVLLAVVTAAVVAPHPAAGQGLDNAPHAQWTDVTALSGLSTSASTKFGGALISDLDGDGWYDVVLNNHDQTHLKLYWNNRRGGFVRGSDLLPPFTRGSIPSLSATPSPDAAAASSRALRSVRAFSPRPRPAQLPH